MNQGQEWVFASLVQNIDQKAMKMFVAEHR